LPKIWQGIGSVKKNLLHQQPSRIAVASVAQSIDQAKFYALAFSFAGAFYFYFYFSILRRMLFLPGG
jgi:hypothetical protein